MRTQRSPYLLLLLPGIPAVAGLVWLAISALESAADAGNADAWLMAWVLLFVVGLPLLLACVAMIGALRMRGGHHVSVPNSGWKIP
jgi:hypothetical protein